MTALTGTFGPPPVRRQPMPAGVVIGPDQPSGWVVSVMLNHGTVNRLTVLAFAIQREDVETFFDTWHANPLNSGRCLGPPVYQEILVVGLEG